MALPSVANGGLVTWAGVWLDVKDKWPSEGTHRAVDVRSWAAGHQRPWGKVPD